MQYVGLPNTYASKGCNDDTWPDGEGSFHGDGATPYGMDELVRRMDMLDWTEGFTIRTARIGETECAGTHQLGACYPELEMDKGRTDSFGYAAHACTHAHAQKALASLHSPPLHHLSTTPGTTGRPPARPLWPSHSITLPPPS